MSRFLKDIALGFFLGVLIVLIIILIWTTGLKIGQLLLEVDLLG